MNSAVVSEYDDIPLNKCYCCSKYLEYYNVAERIWYYCKDNFGYEYGYKTKTISNFWCRLNNNRVILPTLTSYTHINKDLLYIQFQFNNSQKYNQEYIEIPNTNSIEEIVLNKEIFLLYKTRAEKILNMDFLL